MAWHPSSHGTGCGLKGSLETPPTSGPNESWFRLQRGGFCRGGRIRADCRSAEEVQDTVQTVHICGGLRGKRYLPHVLYVHVLLIEHALNK